MGPKTASTEKIEVDFREYLLECGTDIGALILMRFSSINNVQLCKMKNQE
jgi:hypothetical protein